MADPSIAEAVALPPKEAIAFLRQKTNQTTERWTDVWNHAHSRAFSVAGAASEALVQDFRDAVTRAIEQGTTLAAFRKDFDSIVAKHGWVHNGSAGWRSQIIYETNLSTAYSAGRYAQMTEPDILEAFPYWRYQHNAAVHPRIQHLEWSGLVLRADDPWWSTHYPPNGWRCHCSVSAVSEGGLRRMGRTAPDTAPPVDLQKVRLKVGEGATREVEVPRGIDPGFGYNPGEAWLNGSRQSSDIRRQMGHLPARAEPGPPVAKTVPRMAATPDQVRAFVRKPEGSIKVGALHPDIGKAIGARQSDVLLSADTMDKQAERHPDLTETDYVKLADIVSAPSVAFADGDGRTVLFKRIGRLLYVAVKTTADGGENYVVSLFKARPKDVRRLMRRGTLLLGSPEALLSRERK